MSNSPNLPENIAKIIQDAPPLELILKDLEQVNAQAYLVGGSVRDLFLAAPVKDLDIEIHNITVENLTTILSKYGFVDKVGKSFGVLKILGINIDWSLPRTDSAGRKPTVSINPFMNIKEAFKRRDLTINSMGIDLITKELVDPFNGLRDLENKRLKATDKEFFTQDPLRFFRVMQFISRFEMQPDQELDDICKNMDISKVSKERIESEFGKLLLKSKRPSLGIRWLLKIGRLKDVLPELYATVGVPQNHAYHPEGDVFEHSMQALDEAAKLDFENDQERLVLLWAALCHDLGKSCTTEIIDNKIRSIGHEIESEKLAKILLKRVTDTKDLIEEVCRLCRYHMEPLQFIQNGAKNLAYKRLALKLHPITNIKTLCKLVASDKLARKVSPSEAEPKLEDLDAFINKAKELGVFESIELPILTGKDLINELGAGPHLGEILRDAYQLQISENINDKAYLKELMLKKYCKNVF